MLQIRSLSFAFLSILCCTSAVHGLNVPFERRDLERRASFVTSHPGSNDTRGTGRFGLASGPVDNKQDLRYATNITINGKEVPVALDTGSTDLWVNPPDGIGPFNDTRIPLQLRYGDGSYGASGTIGVAPFKFDTYEILRQAFLHVTQSTIRGLDDLGVYGILGLSFDLVTASPINAVIKNRYGASANWGASVLRNIFNQYPNEPNVVALRLARTDDLEDTKGGSFTIGEYNSNYTAVTQAPKLRQYPKGGDRWTILLEGIYVDGNPAPVTSNITGVPTGNAQTMLDSGDPFSMFPIAIWDGIYSRIPGAVKYTDDEGPVWFVPCNTTTIVEFAFGNLKYAVHPLDLSLITRPFQVSGRQLVACYSSFHGVDGFSAQGFDISLGDTFLRNVYTAFNFGDNSTQGEPYIQLLNTTDTRRAISQVTTIRGRTMASLPPELPPAELVRLLGPSRSTTSLRPSQTASPDEKKVQAHVASESSADVDGNLLSIGVSANDMKKYWLIALSLLGANVIIGLVLLVFAVLSCVRKGSAGKRSAQTTAQQYVPVHLRDDGESAYSKHYGQ